MVRSCDLRCSVIRGLTYFFSSCWTRVRVDLVRWKELLYLFLRTSDGADDAKQFNTQQRTTACRQTAICNASQNHEDYLGHLDFWQKKSNFWGKKCLINVLWTIILNINKFFLILILLVITRKGFTVCKVSLEQPSKILPRDSSLRQCGCTCTENWNVPSFCGDNDTVLVCGLESDSRQVTSRLGENYYIAYLLVLVKPL